MITPKLKYIDHPIALGYNLTASQNVSACSTSIASRTSSAAMESFLTSIGVSTFLLAGMFASWLGVAMVEYLLGDEALRRAAREACDVWCALGILCYLWSRDYQ